MTIAEVTRYEEGAIWRLKQKAQFDYALANLIGISSARMMSNDVKFPAIEDVYSNLFEKPSQQELEVAKEDEAVTKSVNRFMEFAMRHNSLKRKEGGENT
jgi:ferritin